MGEHDAFGGILASLHDAMLDDGRWPAASSLIDEACGLTGNDLIVREGPLDAGRVLFVGAYCRGQRREDQERDYLENYCSIDERVPRFRQLPDSRLVHVRDLLTADQLKTSATYNDMLRRTGGQDSLNARLDGPDGSSITWGLRDPVDADGWGLSRVTTVTALLPHIRQFVRVRHALVRAEARHTTVTALLDNPRIGILHLDRRGRVLAANDRARSILRHGDGLTDRGGMLGARAPADQVRLERLVGGSGSILLRRSPVLPPFVVHVKPVRVPQPDYGARHVAALVQGLRPAPVRRRRQQRVARPDSRPDRRPLRERARPRAARTRARSRSSTKCPARGARSPPSRSAAGVSRRRRRSRRTPAPPRRFGRRPRCGRARRTHRTSKARHPVLAPRSRPRPARRHRAAASA
ncbi:MAG: hypothetical protein OXF93_01525 [Acidobacteria bacterium]|nr:hypothetical protein [Acidobacteriota bacterium]